MESVEAIAQKLVSNVEQRTDGLLTLTDEWDELKQDIAAALRAERAKERERLIAAVVAAITACDKSFIIEDRVAVTVAARALAAFDAKNAKEQSK